MCYKDLFDCISLCSFFFFVWQQRKETNQKKENAEGCRLLMGDF
jgi:hypothetical protein